MQRARSRRPLATIGAAFSIFVLAGCAGTDEGTVCPPIGYFSTLHVTFEGQTPDEVKLCADDVCAPSDEAAAEGMIVTPPTVAGATWTFTGQFAPDLTILALAADGTVLADGGIDPEWVRTGGSAECGGPAEASVTVRT